MLQASQRAIAASNGRFPSPLLLFKRYRKSVVPKGGWNNENFQTANGRALVRDIIDVTRQARLRGIRDSTAALTRVMTGHVDSVVDAAVNRYRRIYGARGLKESVTISFDAHAALWESAIQDELRLAGVEVFNAMMPKVQSVVDDTYNKIGMLLGSGTPSRQMLHSLDMRARDIGKQVTMVSETTRDRIRTSVSQAIRSNMTVFEAAEHVRKNVPTIATNRIPTIVRTEIGRASDEATKASMKDSYVVSHASVVGCEKIEENGPRYRGIPTCNIGNVPTSDIDAVAFHINHTGTWVTSGFFQSSGDPAPNITRRG